MKKLFIKIILLGFCFSVYAQEDLSVNNFWTYNGDMTNALYNHICSCAFSQINERWAYVGGLKTKEEWLNRQAETKKIMAEMVGAFPAKTPLNPVITGTIKKEGFIVEKLHFESRPGYFVTAAMFIPTGKKGPLPAILFCSGHHQNAFKWDVYQLNIINLVKKGFIVFAFDPVGQGERIQYFDNNGKRLFGSTHEHSYPGSQSCITGYSPANYFIWDGIRAIDYLVSRPEVDPQRIGVTGHSGGGTQTAYIAAMDDRVVAAAPECYITSFDKLLRSFGVADVEQNLLYALKKGFDMSDLIEIRAPKPTLIVATSRDYFNLQGTRDVFNEALNAYTALGAPDHIQLSEDDAGHSCTEKNREAIVAFFQKHLNNPGDPKEEKVDIFDEKELWVTPAGQVQTSLKGETLFSLNEKQTTEVLRKRRFEKKYSSDYLNDLIWDVKMLTGYDEPVLPKASIYSGRLWRDDCAIEKYLLKGPGDYYIPLLKLSIADNNGKTILLFDDQGKASAAAKGGLAEQLALKGYQVIVPDLNGFGELSGGFKGGDARIQDVPMNIWYAGILTQKSPLAIRMEEIKIITAFAKALSPSGSLSAIASGTLTSDLLHAALIDNSFDQMVLVNPLLSYQSIVQERNYHPKFVMSTPPYVLTKYDLPELVQALSLQKICMINPINALDQPVDPNVFERTYGDYFNLYHLTVVFNENDVFSQVINRLKNLK